MATDGGPYYDTNGDGAGDANKSGSCAGGGVSWNPVNAGVPGNAVVTGLDVLFATPGTAIVDNISIGGLGITITDTSVARTA